MWLLNLLVPIFKRTVNYGKKIEIKIVLVSSLDFLDFYVFSPMEGVALMGCGPRSVWPLMGVAGVGVKRLLRKMPLRKRFRGKRPQ